MPEKWICSNCWVLIISQTSKNTLCPSLFIFGHPAGASSIWIRIRVGMWIKKTRRNRNPCIGERWWKWLTTSYCAQRHAARKVSTQQISTQPNAATTAIASCNFRKGTVQCQGRSPAHVSVDESSAPEGSWTPCLSKPESIWKQRAARSDCIEWYIMFRAELHAWALWAMQGFTRFHRSWSNVVAYRGTMWQTYCKRIANVAWNGHDSVQVLTCFLCFVLDGHAAEAQKPMPALRSSSWDRLS